MTEPPENRIRQALWTVISAWDDMLPDGPRVVTAGTIGRTAEEPLPIPPHILDARALTLGRLAGWCLVVIEDRELNTALDGLDVVGMARFLDVHADWLAGHDAADVVLDELSDAARRILRIVEPRGALEFVGPCEVCGDDLRAHPGSSAVCRGCRVVVDAVATREALLREAGDRLMTAAELVTLAPRLWDVQVSFMRINRWVRAGRLVAHGEREDRPVYRVGDVAGLVSEIPERRSA